MKKVSLFVVLIGVIFLNACKRELIPADNVELGKDYFPLTQGHFVEYAIDSIVYNDFTKKIDSTSTFFRDVIGEEFTDNEGRQSFLINRFRRKTTSEPWQELITYYATSTTFNLEVVEDNLRFIKLVFPVKPNTRWYGNSYISSTFNTELQWLNTKNWDYRYNNLSEPFSTGFLNFDTTITINQVDVSTGDSTNSNLYSDRTYAKEVYAKNVGMIYKNVTNWVYQSDVKFRKGFSYTYRATNFN